MGQIYFFRLSTSAEKLSLFLALLTVVVTAKAKSAEEQFGLEERTIFAAVRVMLLKIRLARHREECCSCSLLPLVSDARGWMPISLRKEGRKARPLRVAS